ncbi:catabolic 3-dehydroquinase [Ceraceosorus guamensis]|uniref:Catabolic 3-dehydroquinase n=1 Tax=Ceraceosorus guamensis TaxID=1522189 RepID=A0A316VM35_9BASI|nr:catabolic 3-dehydroquinase [Ceraceosorus guamensis]PWN38626.1 catabolic 3-dehydroquinase [Ceraceosorus guamensis]
MNRYGTETLSDIVARAEAQASSYGIKLEALQTNHEGVLLDRIHAARTDGTEAIVINAGAWTHTSVAIRDALLGIDCPFIELHISNTHARESFRHHSYLSDKASAVILGMGTFGYTAAIEHCARNLRKGGLSK